jgi:NAD(P)-dependent dehydrogenase (short-subunit alcohol dehydrogenase family)
MNIEELLTKNDLSEYVDIIKKHKLNADTLSVLDLIVMKEDLGIYPLGDRIKLRSVAANHINKIKSLTSKYMNISNLDMDTFNIFTKLTSGDITIQDLEEKYPDYYVNKVISNFDIYQVQQYKHLLSQGVINCIYEKTSIMNKYNYQNNKTYTDLCIPFFEHINGEYIHKTNYLCDEEKDLPCLSPENFKHEQYKPIKENIIKTLTDSLKDDLDWNGIVIAGGYVSSMIFNTENKTSDIDIFFIKLSDKQVKEKIQHICNVFGVTELIRTPNTLTFPYKGRYIQLVLRVCDSVAELLSFFDLDCCAVAFDGKDIITLPRFIKCYATKTNFVDVRKLNTGVFCKRINKYYRRGFRFCFGLYGKYLSSEELKFVTDVYNSNIENVFSETLNDTYVHLYENFKLPDITRNIMNDIQKTHDVIKLTEIDKIDNFIDKGWRENIYFVKDFIRNCYSCKCKYTIDTSKKIHTEERDNYPKLCDSCYEKNIYYKNQVELLDFKNKVVMITGGRVNIGKELVMYFLRKNAIVITTTRFPTCMQTDFSKMENYESFKDRLFIYGVDFRHRDTVLKVLNHINSTFNSIDIVINCAAQTIKRSSEYHKKELQIEMSKQITNDDNNVTNNMIVTLPESVSYELIASNTDQYTNSWTLKMSDISDLELMEVHMVNSIVPFMIIRQLKDKMIKKTGYSHIVNVTSPEGVFNTYKNSNHPHTNMAKASLNMLTRTASHDFKIHNILMNCTDTGWVTDMLTDSKNTEKVPLKVTDSIQRVLYPIWLEMQGTIEFGKFFQEFKSENW